MNPRALGPPPCPSLSPLPDVCSPPPLIFFKVRLHVNDEGERKRLRKEVLGNPSTFDIAVTT